MTSSEKAPESFGTFEKRAPGLNEARTHDPAIALPCSTNWTIKPTGNWSKKHFNTNVAYAKTSVASENGHKT